MKLTWVNHASYIVEGYGVKMICDPWIDGRVFNRSWALVSPSKFTVSDYQDITHIWFSHEHPDHFFPPNIKAIPEEYRKNITVFFQETIDKRVISFCKKMGFRAVVEVSAGKPYAINEFFTALIVKVKNDTDSWMYLQTPDCSILNLNDCVLDEKDEHVLLRTIKKVDVLLTQFSFASWVGNEDQPDLIRAAAEEKKAEIARYVALTKAPKVIPFASYVWFCTPDNFYFNSFANRIDAIVRYIGALGSQPLVFYPGDQWDFQSPVDNERAIDRYLKDIEKISIDACTSFESLREDELIEVTNQFVARALRQNNRRKLLAYEPFVVDLYDIHTIASISYRDGFQKRSDLAAEKADIKMHSQHLKVCLSTDYGFDTILVAGTFQKPSLGNFNTFMEYEWVANLNNQGKRMKGLFGRILDRLKRF